MEIAEGLKLRPAGFKVKDTPGPHSIGKFAKPNTVKRCGRSICSGESIILKPKPLPFPNDTGSIGNVCFD
jgi:hypothetical protein